MTDIATIMRDSPVIAKLIHEEDLRQRASVELIASENFCSEAVRCAMGSCLTNKYCEGYPDIPSAGNSGRYYGGCEVVDKIEDYCRYAWQRAFSVSSFYHVNVQPHSGSQANAAAFAAVLHPGDIVLSLSLNDGGHLTHGSPVNFSGKTYNFVHYGLLDSGYIDYFNLASMAQTFKPKLILAGASAYSRIIDFEKIYQIAQNVGAYFMVDMAHIAGLVAAGLHPTPFGLADIVTTTTHKTLRGPRGGLIFCKPAFAKRVDSAVFPGTQGGPLMHVIAAKAICADEVCTPQYDLYMRNVVDNSKAMAERFIYNGLEVVTGGTDNHMFLLNFEHTHPKLTGLKIETVLNSYGITVNKNCVPNELKSPKQTSGIRIGTAAMTTKGFTKDDFIHYADKISTIIKEID